MTKKKPKRKPPAAVKAAADRAEARSAGKSIDEPKVPIDGPTQAELMEAAEKRTRRYIAKIRMSYTPELGAEICWRMETRDPVTGQVRSLTDICAEDDMPAEASVRRWRRQYPEFGAMYEAARQERAHMLADDVIEISDTETDHQRARNRIAARQWYASKVNKQGYGEAADRHPPAPAFDDESSKPMADLSRRVALVLREMLERRKAAQVIEAQPTDDADQG
jgi:hypothetical protein